jgi:hypothetical protein
VCLGKKRKEGLPSSLSDEKVLTKHPGVPLFLLFGLLVVEEAAKVGGLAKCLLVLLEEEAGGEDEAAEGGHEEEGTGHGPGG